MGTKNYDNAADLITFSRASGGTSLRKISYGSELVTNGTFDADTDWALGAGVTISGGSLNFNTAGAVGASIPITLTSGNVYQSH